MYIYDTHPPIAALGKSVRKVSGEKVSNVWYQALMIQRHLRSKLHLIVYCAAILMDWSFGERITHYH